VQIVLVVGVFHKLLYDTIITIKFQYEKNFKWCNANCIIFGLEYKVLNATTKSLVSPILL